MLATGAATVPKRDNHDTRRWASSNATAGNKQHDSQSKGRRRFAPIAEWLVVFEHIASKCQVAMRQIPSGNGRIGSIARCANHFSRNASLSRVGYRPNPVVNPCVSRRSDAGKRASS